VRYRLEVRLTAADTGSRVVIRWRRPAASTEPGAAGGEEIADVLGILESADDTTFTVRKSDGQRVVVPLERALAAKVIPPARR
jgi:hypothetical protein